MTDRQILEEILAGQQALYERVGGLEQGQKTLMERVGDLEHGQQGLQADVQEVKQGQTTLERGLGALSVTLQTLDAKMEHKLDDTQESLKALVGDAYDLHGERITALEEEVGLKPRKH